MEVLAPAGNIDQAISVINAGCDAIYGGLSKWNARNRAVNFTLDEYNCVLRLCHEKGVKFYLTLNILLRDEEINEFLELLDSGKMSNPDAFIVMDIGIMNILINNYPDIPIHASTQFGSSSLADVLFLQHLGVSRAILSRELSFDEIQYICDNSNIEIEVFIYGSQCIAFSGQCLFGGVLHGASGNRGRCIGMCRDLYTNNDDIIGQFLYPHDLDALAEVKKLFDIGVCSVKIEGRMREADEISDVIGHLKNDTPAKDGYLGFLSGNLPIEEMFQVKNDRLKLHPIDCKLLSENDLVYCDKKIQYFNNDLQGEVRFIKALWSNGFSWVGDDVAIKLISNQSHLIAIDYINCNGERNKFILQNADDCHRQVDEIYDILESKLEYNLYEFSADVPSKYSLRFKYEELLTIVERINVDKQKMTIFSHPPQIIPKCEVYLTSDVKKTLEYHKANDYSEVIFEIKNIAGLKSVISKLQTFENIIFRIPRVYFSNSVDEMLFLLQGKRIIVGKASHFEYIQEKNYKYMEIIADYSVNVWNSYSYKFICDKGISGIVFHPELSFDYQWHLAKQYSLKAYILGMGCRPLGYTRGCFGKIVCSSCKSGNIESSLQNIQKGFGITINCNPELQIRELIPNIIFYSMECDDKIHRIYDDSVENNNAVETTYIELYRRNVN